MRWLHLGQSGAVLCLVAYLGLLGGFLWLRFRSGAWRTMHLIDPAVQAPR